MFRHGLSRGIRLLNRPAVQSYVASSSRVLPFHTSGRLAVKKFSDTENDFAHQVLQRSVVGGGLLERSSGVGGGKLPVNRELLDRLHRVVEGCSREGVCISDGQFDEFVEELVSKVGEFSDEELVEVLKALVDLGPTTAFDTRNYVSIWGAVDKVCLSRVPTWSAEQMLFMADQWYPLRLAKVGRFVGKAVWKISNKLRKLPKEQLVKTVFYINLTRVPVENMVDIEINLKQNIHNFEIDDIAVLCMGFFKTETPIRSVELIERIYQLVIHHAADVQDISLAAILKVLRYSSKIPHAPSMERFLDAFLPHIPKTSLFCCLHLALLGTDIHLCHQPSLVAVMKRFTSEIKQLRLKDMERIAFAVGHYNLTLPDATDVKLLRAILDELPNRIHEITNYPKSYLALLNFLTLKEVYSEELITAAFDRRFLQMTYGRNLTGAGREVISLEAFLRINLHAKDYTGNHFPEKPFKTIAKLTQDYVPSPDYRLTKSDRMLLEVQDTFRRRHKYAHIIHVLPHYQRPDVVTLWNADAARFEDVEARCPEQYSGEILSRERLLGGEEDAANTGHLRLIAIVAGGWNCYIRGENRISGGFAMKLKQLALVGLETVVIPWHEWPAFAPEQRDAFLRDKLDHLLQSKK